MPNISGQQVSGSGSDGREQNRPVLERQSYAAGNRHVASLHQFDPSREMGKPRSRISFIKIDLGFFKSVSGTDQRRMLKLPESQKASVRTIGC